MTPETTYCACNEELIQQMRNGDDRARDEIVAKNLGLVRSIVKKFLFQPADEDDLFQIGCIGLLKAAERFDESFGAKFSTYAVPLIIGEIKRYLRDDGTVKVSRRLKEVAFKARREIERDLKTTGREPMLSELAQRVGADLDELILSLSSVQPVESLSGPVSSDDEDYTLESRLPADDQEGGFIDKLALRELLHTLPPDEQKLIYLRFFRDSTQSETAKVLKTSQVQVSRMEKKILARLKELLERAI